MLRRIPASASETSSLYVKRRLVRTAAQESSRDVRFRDLRRLSRNDGSTLSKSRKMFQSPREFSWMAATISTDSNVQRTTTYRHENGFKVHEKMIQDFHVRNTISALQSTPYLCQQQRLFSSRRKNNKNSSKESGPVANEELIKVLTRQFPKAAGPHDINIRLVIDEGPEAPATVELCSLADAIELSVDRMTDLIGTALKSDPPVVRAAQLWKLEYQKEQAAAKQKAAAKTKQKKTFRFRAGIDTHDLERKIQDMTKFLQKGMECEYTVFSKARTLRANSNAGMDLVDRIQDLVADFAVLKKPPQKNETGNHIRVILMPKKGS